MKPKAGSMKPSTKLADRGRLKLLDSNMKLSITTGLAEIKRFTKECTVSNSMPAN